MHKEDHGRRKPKQIVSTAGSNGNGNANFNQQHGEVSSGPVDFCEVFRSGNAVSLMHLGIPAHATATELEMRASLRGRSPHRLTTPMPIVSVGWLAALASLLLLARHTHVADRMFLVEQNTKSQISR
ncbi:unnamed protein product [Fusarium venenatum]|uniref:Uncharacterized protein n=1 Tax=Fusarium venenatum TaxID=56646 RepID=A0A2L2TFZ5_9HYPO|nr:uncharacterized protein FVRRES_08966 [Fusarium venenatum]CEI68889.1 unnamed protein product [Fusarium venenatum]